MSEKRRRFDREFREGAVRIVRETNKPIAQVAADLGINAGTLGNWVNQDKINRGGVERLSGMAFVSSTIPTITSWAAPFKDRPDT